MVHAGNEKVIAKTEIKNIVKTISVIYFFNIFLFPVFIFLNEFI